MRVLSFAIAAACVVSACGDDDPATPDSGGPTDGGVQSDGGSTGTDAGPGIDAGPRTDGGPELDGGPAGDAGGAGTLTNAPGTCMNPGYTSADFGNGGHYAATRLTPPSFPFTVTSVHYALIHNPGTCDADGAHDVLVFTGTGTTPPGTPAGETISVAAASTPTPAGTRRAMDLTLDTPVVVNSGEELFVAVQMQRIGDPLCLEECLDPGEADRNFWSAAPAPPFPWRTLASYGNDGTLTIGVRAD
jgi:hypothetical protein